MTLGFFSWLPGSLAHQTVSWPVAILLGGIVAIPFGAIVAIPAIRLAGIYVAVATFGFGILLQRGLLPGSGHVRRRKPGAVPAAGQQFSVGPTTKRFEAVNGTSAGLFGIDFSDERNYYYLALSVLVIMVAIVLLVQRSRLGALLRAMADSPIALEAHGANTNIMRIVVFCLSAFMAGVGGGVVGGRDPIGPVATRRHVRLHRLAGLRRGARLLRPAPDPLADPGGVRLPGGEDLPAVRRPHDDQVPAASCSARSRSSWPSHLPSTSMPSWRPR